MTIVNSVISSIQDAIPFPDHVEELLHIELNRVCGPHLDDPAKTFELMSKTVKEFECDGYARDYGKAVRGDGVVFLNKFERFVDDCLGMHPDFVRKYKWVRNKEFGNGFEPSRQTHFRLWLQDRAVKLFDCLDYRRKQFRIFNENEEYVVKHALAPMVDWEEQDKASNLPSSSRFKRWCRAIKACLREVGIPMNYFFRVMVRYTRTLFRYGFNCTEQ